MEDVEAGVAIVATFGSEYASSRGVDGVELCGGKEAAWKYETHGF